MMLYKANTSDIREFNVLSELALYLLKVMFLKTFKIAKSKNYEV